MTMDDIEKKKQALSMFEKLQAMQAGATGQANPMRQQQFAPVDNSVSPEVSAKVRAAQQMLVAQQPQNPMAPGTMDAMRPNEVSPSEEDAMMNEFAEAPEEKPKRFNKLLGK